MLAMHSSAPRIYILQLLLVAERIEGERFHSQQLGMLWVDRSGRQ